MRVHYWFEQRGHRALLLISAQQRTQMALIQSDESAGPAEMFLRQAGLLLSFCDHQRSVIVEHERAVAPQLVGSCLEPIRSSRTIGIARELCGTEHENWSHPRALPPVSSRQHFNSPEL